MALGGCETLSENCRQFLKRMRSQFVVTCKYLAGGLLIGKINDADPNKHNSDP